jgi:hypothetical protein
METSEISRTASILSISAIEAAEEPDAIERRPEIVDLLEQVADRDDLGEVFERVIPGLIEHPDGFLRTLAQDLAPFRSAPLEDAPELVLRLAFVAKVFQVADSLDVVSETAALAFA